MPSRGMITLDIPEEELESLIKASELEGITVEEFVNKALESWIRNNHPEDWKKIMEDRENKGIKEEDLVKGALYVEEGTTEEGDPYRCIFEYIGKANNYKPCNYWNCPFVFFDLESGEVGLYSKVFLDDLIVEGVK